MDWQGARGRLLPSLRLDLITAFGKVRKPTLVMNRAAQKRAPSLRCKTATGWRAYSSPDCQRTRTGSRRSHLDNGLTSLPSAANFVAKSTAGADAALPRRCWTVLLARGCFCAHAVLPRRKTRLHPPVQLWHAGENLDAFCRGLARGTLRMREKPACGEGGVRPRRSLSLRASRAPAAAFDYFQARTFRPLSRQGIPMNHCPLHAPCDPSEEPDGFGASLGSMPRPMPT